MRETWERIKFDTEILDALFLGRITLAALQSDTAGGDIDEAMRGGTLGPDGDAAAKVPARLHSDATDIGNHTADGGTKTIV